MLPKTIPYYLAEEIRHRIVCGKYPPGSSLREQDLGEEFGSSRGPVREGLRLLELQGLVTHSPRRGFSVREYSEEDLDSLYQLRALLEGSVMDALAKMDVTPLVAELKEVNAKMKQHAELSDLDDYFEENIRFHQKIVDFTQNKTLIRVLSIVNDMSLPVRYLLHCDKFPQSSDYGYHNEIISALSRQSFADAKRLTMAHIMENLPRIKERYRLTFGD